MHLDVEDLRLFLYVAEAGSITAGARQAHLALSSASERLSAIEADAGIALIQRHPRGVSLTEAGATLAHHARVILQQRSLLRDELQSFAGGARGTLHLYANTAALTTLLPTRIGPWLADRPRLRVELLERTSVEIVSAITAGHAEAGIVSDAVDAGNLHRHPIADDPLVVLLPPSHRLTERRRLTFAEIADEAFVALADGNALQTHIEDQARRAGLNLNVRIRMKTFDGLCTLVSQGIGIGIVPRAIVRRNRHTPRAVAVRLNDSWARRRLCVCFADWSVLSPAMRSLLEHLSATPLGTSDGNHHAARGAN